MVTDDVAVDGESLKVRFHAASCSLQTVAGFSLDTIVAERYKKPVEISCFHAGNFSHNLFVGTSTGRIFILNSGGEYLMRFKHKPANRIFYLYELSEDTLLALDSSMRVIIWDLTETQPKVMLTKKLPKVHAEHVRHIVCSKTSVFVLVIAAADSILLLRVCFHVTTAPTVSRCFRVQYTDQCIENVDVHMIPSGDLCANVTDGEIPCDGEITLLLSLLVPDGVLLVHVSISESSCAHTTVTRISALPANSTDSSKVHFAWATHSRAPAKLKLCISHGETIAVYNVMGDEITRDLETTAPISPDVLHWIDSSTIMGVNVISSKIFLLDTSTQNSSLFSAPKTLQADSTGTEENIPERWRYSIQAFGDDYCIQCLPKAHRIRLTKDHAEGDRETALKNFYTCATSKAVENSPDNVKSIENTIRRILSLEEENFHEADRTMLVPPDLSARYVHFFRPSQRLLDYFIDNTSVDHHITNLFGIFTSFQLEDILIFLLEFAICEGRITRLPNSITDLLCERFTQRFHEHEGIEKICLLLSPSRTVHLAQLFQSGRLYRLDVCLANLVGDIGYTIRKALDFDLYRVICTQHNAHFADFRGPIRKLRTIGTSEALHVLMEYILLLSRGKTFTTGISPDKKALDDVRSEALTHLSDKAFFLQLLRIDVVKCLALVDGVLMSAMDDESLEKIISSVAVELEDSSSTFSPNVIDRLFWHAHRLLYVSKGILQVDDVEKSVSLDVLSILKLHEEISIDDQEATDIFMQRADYQPSYKAEVYEEERVLIHSLISKALFRKHSDTQPCDFIDQCDFLFTFHPNIESFRTVKLYHELLLLHCFNESIRSDETISLLQSLPHALEKQFVFFFAGIQFHQKGDFEVFHWMLQTEALHTNEMVFDFLEAKLRKLSTIPSDASSNVVFVFLHNIEKLLGMDSRRCASIVWKYIPECHIAITQILENTPSALLEYCNSTTHFFGFQSRFGKTHSTCGRSLPTFYRPNDPRSQCKNRPQSPAIQFTRETLEQISKVDAMSAFSFVSCLFENNIISEKETMLICADIDFIGARALHLGLSGNVALALALEKIYFHVKKTWEDLQRHASDVVEGDTDVVETCLTCDFVHKLQGFIDALEMVSVVFDAAHSEMMKTLFHEFLDVLVKTTEEVPCDPSAALTQTLSQLNHRGVLMNWAASQAREHSSTLRKNASNKVENFVAEAIDTVKNHFIAIYTRKALQHIQPIDLWKNISSANRSALLPHLLQQSAFTIKTLEETIEAQNREKQRLFASIEQQFQEKRSLRKVFTLEKPTPSLADMQQLVPIVASFPCGHVVEAYERLYRCPVCPEISIDSTGQNSCDGSHVPCSTISTRLKRFRKRLDGLLLTDSNMSSYLENAQRSSGGDLATFCMVKQKNDSPAIEPPMPRTEESKMTPRAQGGKVDGHQEVCIKVDRLRVREVFGEE